jgi:hypothetical protein
VKFDLVNFDLVKFDLVTTCQNNTGDEEFNFHGNENHISSVFDSLFVCGECQRNILRKKLSLKSITGLKFKHSA